MNVVGANRGDGMRVLLALLDDLVIVKAHQLLVLDLESMVEILTALSFVSST